LVRSAGAQLRVGGEYIACRQRQLTTLPRVPRGSYFCALAHVRAATWATPGAAGRKPSDRPKVPLRCHGVHRGRGHGLPTTLGPWALGRGCSLCVCGGGGAGEAYTGGAVAGGCRPPTPLARSSLPGLGGGARARGVVPLPDDGGAGHTRERLHRHPQPAAAQGVVREAAAHEQGVLRLHGPQGLVRAYPPPPPSPLHPAAAAPCTCSPCGVPPPSRDPPAPAHRSRGLGSAAASRARSSCARTVSAGALAWEPAASSPIPSRACAPPPPHCRVCRLEKLLRSYSCLTKGDTVRFKYLRTTFEMRVVDLKPAVRAALVVGAVADPTLVSARCPAGRPLGSSGQGWPWPWLCAASCVTVRVRARVARACVFVVPSLSRTRAPLLKRT
jgi:hypothetical protein